MNLRKKNEAIIKAPLQISKETETMYKCDSGSEISPYVTYDDQEWKSDLHKCPTYTI